MPVTNFDIAFTLANTQTFLNLSTNKYFKIYDTLVIRKDNYSGTLEKGESAILEFPEITQSDCKSAFNCIRTSVSNIYNNDVYLFEYDGLIPLAEATTDEVAQAKWMSRDEIMELYRNGDMVKVIKDLSYFMEDPESVFG